MATEKTRYRKPSIKIGQSEYDKLTVLADNLSTHDPDIAEDLFGELERARIVSDDKVGKNVIRIGSTSRYVTDTREDRTVTLVYPAEADIAAGKVSILTPIGTALLGLSPGQTIEWEGRDGRARRLTIEEVSPLADASGSKS